MDNNNALALTKCYRKFVARYSETACQHANMSKRQENENKTSDLPEEIRTQELGWILFVRWFPQRPSHVQDNNVSDQQ